MELTRIENIAFLWLFLFPEVFYELIACQWNDNKFSTWPKPDGTRTEKSRGERSLKNIFNVIKPNDTWYLFQATVHRFFLLELRSRNIFLKIIFL